MVCFSSSRRTPRDITRLETAAFTGRARPAYEEIRTFLHDRKKSVAQLVYVNNRGSIGQRHHREDKQGSDAIDVDQVGGLAVKITNPSNSVVTVEYPRDKLALRPASPCNIQWPHRLAVFLPRASIQGNGAVLEITTHLVEDVDANPRCPGSRQLVQQQDLHSSRHDCGS
jgi:hypothetical protein